MSVSIALGKVKNVPKNFKAGNIICCVEEWAKITSDKWLLNIVKDGYGIEFQTKPVLVEYSKLSF